MEIIYKPNKTRLIITLVGLSIFIVVGLLFINYPQYFASSYFTKMMGVFGKPLSVQIIGVFTVVFFSLYSFGVLTILISNYGLIINERGFINNTSLTNAGLILWEDVKGVKIDKGRLNTIIFVYVKDERKYFNRIKNPLIRLNALIYNKTYKVSFVIDTGRIKITEDELLKIFKKYTKL